MLIVDQCLEPGDFKLYNWDQGQMIRGSRYLYVSQLLLLLPVPDRQDVIVGIVHSAEEGAAVLTEQWGVRSSSSEATVTMFNHLTELWKSSGCETTHRLGESHAGDRSVEHSHPDHMQRVEAHRVPNTNVRSQQLHRQVGEIKKQCVVETKKVGVNKKRNC